jgi:serine/threonine protein kinase
MSTSLADVLSVSKLPLEDVATVWKGVITGLCYLHKDLMISHGAITGENVPMSKTGDVKLGAFSLISFMNVRVMNRSLLSANGRECLLAQPAKQEAQKDVWSPGLLLVEMREPGSVFLGPPPSTLQRPDSSIFCAVDLFGTDAF